MKLYYAIFFLAAFFCASTYFCQTNSGYYYRTNLASNESEYSKNKRQLAEVTVTSRVLPDDTLDLSSRFYAGDKSYSHIPLDFACVKKDVDTANTIIVSKSYAVHVAEEDIEWVKQQFDTLSEEDIETIIDDNAFYYSETCQAFEKAHIPVKNIAREKPYISFKKADGKIFTIDLKWFKYSGWILFNNKKDPELINIFSVEEAIKEMFKK